MNLMNYVRTVPDFPKPGILFYDTTTVLKNPDALRGSVDALARRLDGVDFEIILGPESRGFIFGMPLAYNLKKSFEPVRKAGKIPGEVIRKDYVLEYGTATIEMHGDAVRPGQRVVIADDLLATGGTARAIAELVEGMGATVAAVLFFMELKDLKGREALKGYDVRSVLVC